MRAVKIALLCSGLGRIRRGHEVFARGLFDLLADTVDITLFKGGGEASAREVVVDNLPRNAACLEHVHVAASPKWAAAAREEERDRIEAKTFGYAALKPLLEGGFDIVHCLEREVCNTVHDHRHLFRRTPQVVFSNGGAIPARDLPRCDFVQEHTEHNLAFSDRRKAFMIPHGVDLKRFRPGVATDFRLRHGIPADAFVVISVGTIGRTHKRMDHVVEEVARVDGAHLVVVGQESPETPAVKALGERLMAGRIVFETLPHDALPEAYAAADAFVLGSLFETFGIVYIEAMAMGLPVICTDHVNQRSIVKEGLFVDMKRPGALAAALSGTDRAAFAALGRRGRAVAEHDYDLEVLKAKYLDAYRAIAAAPSTLPGYTLKTRIAANLRNVVRRIERMVHGQAE